MCLVWSGINSSRIKLYEATRGRGLTDANRIVFSDIDIYLGRYWTVLYTTCMSQFDNVDADFLNFDYTYIHVQAMPSSGIFIESCIIKRWHKWVKSSTWRRVGYDNFEHRFAFEIIIQQCFPQSHTRPATVHWITSQQLEYDYLDFFRSVRTSVTRKIESDYQAPGWWGVG